MYVCKMQDHLPWTSRADSYQINSPGARKTWVVKETFEPKKQQVAFLPFNCHGLHHFIFTEAFTIVLIAFKSNLMVTALVVLYIKGPILLYLFDLYDSYFVKSLPFWFSLQFFEPPPLGQGSWSQRWHGCPIWVKRLINIQSTKWPKQTIKNWAKTYQYLSKWAASQDSLVYLRTP